MAPTLCGSVIWSSTRTTPSSGTSSSSTGSKRRASSSNPWWTASRGTRAEMASPGTMATGTWRCAASPAMRTAACSVAETLSSLRRCDPRASITAWVPQISATSGGGAGARGDRSRDEGRSPGPGLSGRRGGSPRAPPERPGRGRCGFAITGSFPTNPFPPASAADPAGVAHRAMTAHAPSCNAAAIVGRARTISRSSVMPSTSDRAARPISLAAVS